MVYFECQKCNETVKKPKLVKHLESCGSSRVSCIDCSQTFTWETFEAHTSCVSEAQKYRGNLYQPKEKDNKGQLKQDAWVDNIQKWMEDPQANVPVQTRALLERLLGLTNIPRKQKPFANFAKNSLKVWDDARINDMWDVIREANDRAALEAKASGEPASRGGVAKGDAAKGASRAAPAAASAQAPRPWVGWKRSLDEELKERGGELPWKLLRDSLVARYLAGGQGNGAREDELGNQAMSHIPEAYLSQQDELVRLPPNNA